MRVQSVNLNLIPTGVMPIVHLSQYDRDADGALLFNIFNGPAPFNLTGCTATINGTKPDGNVYTYPCTVHSNFLTSAVYDQMTTVQGTHEAEIRISDGDSVVGTLNFQMAIEKAGVSEIDVSHTDVPTLLENIQASVDEAEYWAEQAAGAVAGVASFNGRHGSVLPIAGDYDSEKILLASALHIGGETQNNVQEALEALSDGSGHTILNGLGQEMPQRKNLRFAGANVSDDAENDTTNVTISGGSGGSKIIVTTSESSLHNKDVTISDGLTTATEQFSAGGVATFIGITMTGLLTITSTDGIDTATDTLNVPYYGNYTKAIAFFAFNATLNISTSASSLYGKTITIKKGSTTVGTTAFSAQGSASYTVHETGTYTCECEGYSGSATVSAETTYNVTINAVETYHLTVAIYSAASDTLSYTDDNGAQTVTTDATGKATGVSITITEQTPGTASITFTSSVAKKPDNLSNDYSKSVTLTSSTTAIYVMPDNALYWWGYESPDLEDMTTANGWSYSGLTLTAPTHNTQSISLSGSASTFRGIASKTPKNVNSVSAIANCITADGDIYGWVAASNNKNLNAVTNDDGTFAASGMQYINHVITLMDSGYITLRTGKARNMTVYALWYE